jgi:hypothetical protein
MNGAKSGAACLHERRMDEEIALGVGTRSDVPPGIKAVRIDRSVPPGMEIRSLA